MSAALRGRPNFAQAIAQFFKNNPQAKAAFANKSKQTFNAGVLPPLRARSPVRRRSVSPGRTTLNNLF
jgi:hypothetical protein